jgi:hypothetical protein
MKQEIYQDGKLRMTLQSTDGNGCDIVVMPKVLVKNCSMSAEGFDELFFSFYNNGSVTHTAAYEKAEQVHEQYFEKRKYSDYESYRVSKSKRLNK